MNIKEFEESSSYDRLYKITYNSLLHALLKEGGEDIIFKGCSDLPFMDPEFFRFTWNKSPLFSELNGIQLEVRRINHNVKNPDTLPLSQKIKPWGDMIRAKLIKGNLSWESTMRSKEFSFEQHYSIPEDFSQLISDIMMLVMVTN